ncbi:MAG: metalloprotease, partial [Alphaproteobacteria bacterium]|nr:metalloprotease [Alphaproteobacteria bacterium]
MAAEVNRQRRPFRLASSVAVLVSVGLVLSSCQSLFEQAYEPSVAPSSNPQIVDEVQKGDPRAQMGAREHPRIVASYGGEYSDSKTER